MGASGCGVLYFVWVFVFCFYRVLLFKSMYAKEVKPLLFYQFGLTGVPGKAPVRHQVVQYHIYHMYLIQSLKLFFKIPPVICREYKFLLCCDSSLALCSLILGHPVDVMELNFIHHYFCGIQLRRNIRS